MSFDASVFKAYDLRGRYPEQINAHLARALAHAFVRLIKEEVTAPLKLVVSRDMRLSSPELSQALSEELVKLGVEVIEIGLASTPTFYFAVAYFGYHGGIQVSASHNPKDDNGFKLVRAGSVPISGETGILKLRDWVLAGHQEPTQAGGRLTPLDGVLEKLVQEQTKDLAVEKIKPFKLVIDAANAMGALDLEALLGRLPQLAVTKLNFTLDGTFPAHEADPLKPENLRQLQAVVKAEGADFGLATDGDGDRLFLVMENGLTLKPEILRGILAQIVLRSHPGAKIGFDIRPGKATADMILEAGGEPFLTRVGHSLIKEKMLEVDSPFSGESSGHFFYRFPYGSFEAPVKLMADFLTWLSGEEQPLSQLVARHDRYFHSGEINSVVADYDAVFTALSEKYHDALSLNRLDGLTVEYANFWFNVRGSNTEPKLRLNLEAADEATMIEKRDEVLALIRQKKD